MDLLFNPAYPLFNFPPFRPLKRERDDVYERKMYADEIVRSRRRSGVIISPRQAADISSNNAKTSADGSINTHSDVEYINPDIGEVLTWDGTNWVNTPRGGTNGGIGGISPQQLAYIASNLTKVSADNSISTHNDVTVTNPDVGDLLSWNGSHWVDVHPPEPMVVMETSRLPYLSDHRSCEIGGQTYITSCIATASANGNMTRGTIPFTPYPGDSTYFWNGTTIPYVGRTYAAVWQDLFPNGGIMKGLLQEWDSSSPYADPSSPTILEQEGWMNRQFNLFRKLLGLPPFKFRRTEFLKAQWNLEYRRGGCRTGAWDESTGIINLSEMDDYLHVNELPILEIIAVAQNEHRMNGSMSPYPQFWVSAMLQNIVTLMGAQAANQIELGGPYNRSVISDLLQRSHLGYVCHSHPGHATAVTFDLVFDRYNPNGTLIWSNSNTPN